MGVPQVQRADPEGRYQGRLRYLGACAVSSPTRILVTGGRDYADRATVFVALESAVTRFGDVLIIQGGARGADALAKEWALARGIPCIQMDAAWTALGKRAGRVRNAWMADLCMPDCVLAFPGGTGTADMIAYAEWKRIPVYRI